MKIADIDLGKRPLLLAPMEDVTDQAFRLLAKDFGAALVYTEFISADALIRDVAGSIKKMQIDNRERPVAIQIYGRDVETMVEAAKRVAEANPNLIDLNFGCPVKRVAGKGGGSGMLKTPELLLEITRSIVKAVELPVTVKTRLGWDSNSLIIERLAEELQDCGIAALTIHGRTRAQMYQGEADWTLIGKVKNNPRIHIPIIGNGDITTPEEAKQAFDRYGVDAVMVGRASIGCPWIFEEMNHYLKTGEKLPPMGIEEGMKILKTMVNNNIEKLDERRGILHSRRHIAVSPLFKSIPNFKKMRVAMLRANTKEELFALMDEAEQYILAHIEETE
ncbi:tRNA dihydrouridine synthase DusB [Falsiporphyromonas endometrii]|uniref:tRNA-dihydrouridine synthase n=1 Tax=Falsiporphyromonas endometrii TaxID=1387297 RepID=A0ABV9K640_9PORP